MDNQLQSTPGHRGLSQSEIDLMNEAKAIEAQFNGLIDRLLKHPDTDKRQASIAQTEGEHAFMRAVRSVARPTRFTTE